MDLLRLATRADPASATAFSALFSSLYRHGEDAAAAQSIAAFERAAPHSPMVASSRATLRHQTGAMTLMRAQTLHTQVTRLRQGRPAAVPYADRVEAEAAAVDAFLPNPNPDPNPNPSPNPNQVPLLDMYRYSKLLAGASWMGEFGNPELADEWAFLKRYSPYHRLRRTTQYPPILFTTSTRDDRVHPGQ